MARPRRIDTLIVGAGAMGAATAWRLAQRGRSVVLLEQFGRLHARGSSHGQTRIFRVAYRDPLYTELAKRSLPLWRELEEIAGLSLLEQTGQVDHGKAQAVNEIERSLTTAGFSAERMTPEQAHLRWPGMNFDNAVIYSPDGGRVFSDRTVSACIDAAVAAGVDFRDHTLVEAISVDSGVAKVETSVGTWTAETVVVAAGSWLPSLIQGLVRLPEIRITLQQPVHFAIRPGYRFPSYLHHMHVDDSLGFGAYGLESPGEGVKLGLEATVRDIDIAERTFDLDPAVSASARDYARHWLPGADADEMTETTCLFTETPDGHFLLDRSGPLVICSPCSGHGFKFTPVIGDIVANLAEGRDHGVNSWRLPR